MYMNLWENASVVSYGTKPTHSSSTSAIKRSKILLIKEFKIYAFENKSGLPVERPNILRTTSITIGESWYISLGKPFGKGSSEEEDGCLSPKRTVKLELSAQPSAALAFRDPIQSWATTRLRMIRAQQSRSEEGFG